MLLQRELCMAAVSHQVIASIHIDDLSIAAEGSSREALTQKLGTAARHFRQILEGQYGLPLATSKGQLLASHKDDEQHLRKKSGTGLGQRHHMYAGLGSIILSAGGGQGSEPPE
jgi:hypothetical protein